MSTTQHQMKIELALADAISNSKNAAKNFLYSPLSFKSCAGMVEAVSTGETREELRRILGLADNEELALPPYLAPADGKAPALPDFATMDPEEVRAYLEKNTPTTSPEDLSAYFSRGSDKVMLANSVWVDETAHLIEENAAKLKDDFYAGVEMLPMIAEPIQSADAINSWTSEKTSGMIGSIVSPDSLPKEPSSALLVNTLYFKDRWEDSWNEWGQVEFKQFDGESVKTDFMDTRSCAQYFENDRAVAFSKEYQGGEGIVFVGILPKDKGPFTFTELDIAPLLDNPRPQTLVHAFMPSKIEFDDDHNLNEPLCQVGVEKMFDDVDEIRLAQEPMKIGSIKQKTKIKLDKDGTEAAAVTYMMMDGCAFVDYSDWENIDIVLDRPFAFLIIDKENNILFAGKYTEAA